MIIAKIKKGVGVKVAILVVIIIVLIVGLVRRLGVVLSLAEVVVELVVKFDRGGLLLPNVVQRGWQVIGKLWQLTTGLEAGSAGER